ncbi:hypothetical protein [Rosenbergiella collisarenosi]|uniref:hypothetical protein n=1 Tax=Rosenbergiella collisarenosi TaxID=1544695 RepID=UPI001F501806|nr:hypothetical protein [Rosenbergiella collisarenosi]
MTVGKDQHTTMRALAVTPKADSYRPNVEESKSALLLEELEPSALLVVVNAKAD